MLGPPTEPIEVNSSLRPFTVCSTNDRSVLPVATLVRSEMAFSVVYSNLDYCTLDPNKLALCLILEVIDQLLDVSITGP